MKKYKHLSYTQRYHIWYLLKLGLSQKFIAEFIEVSPSTICRELQRNKALRCYSAKKAHHLAQQRRSRSAHSNANRIPDSIKQEALALINEDWSPDQVAQSLKRCGKSVSHETIYQWIIQDRRQGGCLFEHLRRRQRKYNRRTGNASGRGFIKNRVPIEQRPEIVETRSRYGDWEVDTVIGKQTRGPVLVTLVERKSRFLLVTKAKNRSSREVNRALIRVAKPYSRMIHTMTFDNGKEFANHEQIAESLHCQTYFAAPYHSWQRGTNENTNGLLRQYFPKGQSLRGIRIEQVKQAQDKINNRPKRVLNYNCPQKVFMQAFENSL